MTSDSADKIEYTAENWPEGLVDVTDRLVVRELEMADIPEYYEIVKICPEAVYETFRNLPYEEFEARHRAYIKFQYDFYRYGIWGIYLRGEIKDPDDYVKHRQNRSSIAEGRLIGLVGIVNGSASQVGEISYAILPEYRCQGYAFEACRAALDYAIECGFERFEARIAADNTASLSLAKKLGIQNIYRL